MQNIILIGMPGAGKSTLGVLLAKALAYDFVDTDVVMQVQKAMLLQDILDTYGVEGFLEIEEHCLTTLHVQRSVIATGGSVVYSPAIMRHLQSLGTIVYLQLSLAELMPRLDNLDRRGVVIRDDQSFADVYAERVPLYERYANLTVPSGGEHHEPIVAEIVAKLRDQGSGVGHWR